MSEVLPAVQVVILFAPLYISLHTFPYVLIKHPCFKMNPFYNLALTAAKKIFLNRVSISPS